MRSYTDPVRTIPGVRRDLARLLRAVDTRYTCQAAEALRAFDRPALVAWAAEDRLFPLEHGRRLAELLPRGSFVTVPDSRTFIPEDQPERLASLVRDFLADRVSPSRRPAGSSIPASRLPPSTWSSWARSRLTRVRACSPRCCPIGWASPR